MSTPHACPRDERFARSVVAWQRQHGRHDLPWQRLRDPYQVWLSEVMLQQTQVATVMAYFKRFVSRFPDVGALAAAAEDEVLAQWSGLGYYARARNLHRAAREVQARYAGRFPAQFDDIAALPGIGRSTAGAIAVFAFGQPHAVVDGNVKRVLSRCFGIEGYPGDRKVSDALWALAQRLLPQRDVEAYTQGLMDLGARVCTRGKPNCPACPLAVDCVVRAQGRAGAVPAPRPRKPLPRRATTMLILSCGADVLLEKRPSPGIWGGMWSFPECPDGADVVQACHVRFGAEVSRVDTLAPVEHTFTHFILTINPHVCRVTRLECLAPAHRWFAAEAATSSAIPAPVRRLLLQLQSGLVKRVAAAR